MTDHGQVDRLDGALREALGGNPEQGPASARVVAAVMSQVRREAAARSTQLANLLVRLLVTGVVLAWAGAQVSLSLWPGLAGFLRVPALDAAGALVWWIINRAGATLLVLVSYGFGSLLPLALLGCLVLVPLAVRYAGRSAS